MHASSKYGSPELGGNLGIMKFTLVILNCEKTKAINCYCLTSHGLFLAKFHLLILVLEVYSNQETTKPKKTPINVYFQ